MCMVAIREGAIPMCMVAIREGAICSRQLIVWRSRTYNEFQLRSKIPFTVWNHGMHVSHYKCMMHDSVPYPIRKMGFSNATKIRSSCSNNKGVSP